MACQAIDYYPNATIAEYGVISLEEDGNKTVHNIKAEIFARGPVAAEVNGKALHTYQGGIFKNTTASRVTTHIVSLVGWGTDPETNQQYWIAR